ncbi:hypothetical protein [Streptomyces sp. NPDC020747]|uniref:hypothetical protein n=1 Tax=Streptomyces sp. NPDC020747 TaxID=3365086 RepID=UPI0037968DB2
MAVMAESTSSAGDVMSAIATICLLLTTVVTVYGFICRELLTSPRSSRGGAGHSGTETGTARPFVMGCAAVVVGHIAGSAVRDTWEFEYFFAIEVLVYATALHFLNPVFTQHNWTLSARRATTAGVVLIAFLGSAASASSGGILS